jgi:DNA-binding response OmpR family regulator
MKLLIADDDPFFRKMLADVLAPGHDILLCASGEEAWLLLQKPDAPRLAILDWVMPGFTGPEICRRVRKSTALSGLYLIIMTSKNSEPDIVAGLRAGADDYITKPALPAEIRARVHVGERVLSLQETVKAQSVLTCEALWGQKPAFPASLESRQLSSKAPYLGFPEESDPCGLSSGVRCLMESHHSK